MSDCYLVLQQIVLAIRLTRRPDDTTKAAVMTRLLYIEDDPLNVKMVQKMFKFSGYEVSVAVNGQEGIRAALNLLPDLILLDLNLPDIDGLEVLRRLRQDSRTRTTPILALTARTSEVDRKHALDAGCDDYLPKPTSRAELLKTVQQYLKHVRPLDEEGFTPDPAD